MKIGFRNLCYGVLLFLLSLFIWMIWLIPVNGCFAKDGKDYLANANDYLSNFMPAGNSTENTYIITERKESYVACSDSIEIEKDTLGLLIASIEADGVTLDFSSVKSISGISITKSVNIKGNLTVEAGDVELSGSNINISDFAIEFSDGSLIINKGLVSIDNSSIISDAYFSVENYGELKIGKNVIFDGSKFDVLTNYAISLKNSAGNFDENISVVFNSLFKKGTLTEVFYDVKKSGLKNVFLYDADENSVDVTYFDSHEASEKKSFLAVYNPFYANYYVEGTLYKIDEFLSGDSIDPPETPVKAGYDFCGWYKDDANNVKYSFGNFEYADVSLYSGFSLTAPEFSLQPMNFSYDGAEHFLSVENLYHALDGEGSYSFAWYKNFSELDETSKSISLCNTTDSGSYYCKVIFAYKGEIVAVNTPVIDVLITKKELEIPSVSPADYTGELILPNITSCELYTCISDGGIEAGTYSLTLELTDPVNYKWKGKNDSTLKLPFTVTQSKNEFLSLPEISSSYVGFDMQITAEPKFGKCTYMYSSDAVSWSYEIPDSAGTYYLKVCVAGTSNYTSLESDAIEFTIREEAASKIEVDAYPRKNEYSAYETLDLSGAEFTVTYNSGRVEKIDLSNLKIEYETADSFRAGDEIVKVVYDSAYAVINVKVGVAEYDMSSASWTNTECVYNGRKQYSYLTGLPEGVKVLKYIANSGFNSGEYELSAVLSYDSENFVEPKVPLAKLLIKKCEIELPKIHSVVYDGLSHTSQIEESDLYTFTNAEAVAAGKYIVSFKLTDPENYKFKDGISEAIFEIERRPITVQISKTGNDYSIVSGNVIEGDELEAEFYKEDGYMYIRSANDNYLLTVLAVKVNIWRTYLWLWISLLLLLNVILIGTYVLLRDREKVFAMIESIKNKTGKKRKSAATKEFSKKNTDEPHFEKLMAVDEEYANTLIPNYLAKRLVSDLGNKIRTSGRKHCIVNIDTISNTFSYGDTVDINAMKSHGIIPQDANYVKVLARGIIDKPLNIIANSYSLAAVKMIALTGGSAKRARTSKK